MMICVRTTLNLDDALAAQARRRAAAEGKTLTRLIEDALRAELAGLDRGDRRPVEVPTFPGHALRAGVELIGNRALRDLLEAQEGPSSSVT